MKKTRSASKSAGGIKEFILGILIIWCSFIVFSLIFAAVLFSGDDPTGSASLFSLIAFILSGAVGTVLNRRLFSRSDKNVPLFSALISAVIYLVISTVVSGRISIGALVSMLCFAGSSLAVAIPKKKRQKRRTH